MSKHIKLGTWINLLSLAFVVLLACAGAAGWWGLRANAPQGFDIANSTSLVDWALHPLSLQLGALILPLLLAILLVLALRIAFKRHVLRAMSQIVGHCERIAEGDLTAPVPHTGRGEIRHVWQAVEGMQRSLSATVHALKQGIAGIHSGAQLVANGKT